MEINLFNRSDILVKGSKNITTVSSKVKIENKDDDKLISISETGRKLNEYNVRVDNQNLCIKIVYYYYTIISLSKVQDNHYCISFLINDIKHEPVSEPVLLKFLFDSVTIKNKEVKKKVIKDNLCLIFFLSSVNFNVELSSKSIAYYDKITNLTNITIKEKNLKRKIDEIEDLDLKEKLTRLNDVASDYKNKLNANRLFTVIRSKLVHKNFSIDSLILMDGFPVGILKENNIILYKEHNITSKMCELVLYLYELVNSEKYIEHLNSNKFLIELHTRESLNSLKCDDLPTLTI